MKTVPLFEAKNRLSELIAAAERGDEIAITRRGVAVARLVAIGREGEAGASRAAAVQTTFARLKEIRKRLTLEGDLERIARAGLG